eukprot:1625137-Rhodomonas_salina.1
MSHPYPKCSRPTKSALALHSCLTPGSRFNPGTTRITVMSAGSIETTVCWSRLRAFTFLPLLRFQSAQPLCPCRPSFLLVQDPRVHGGCPCPSPPLHPL